MKLPRWLAFALRWATLLLLLYLVVVVFEQAHSRWVDRVAGKTFEAVGKQIKQ